MWWEVVLIAHLLARDVMAQMLALDSSARQASGLHGFGQWKPRNRRTIEPKIDS
jgi:hypothetical protein